MSEEIKSYKTAELNADKSIELLFFRGKTNEKTSDSGVAAPFPEVFSCSILGVLSN